MNIRKLFLIVSTFGLLCLFPQQQAEATDSNLTRSSLKGLSAFKVVVEQLDSKIEGKGLTRQQLQTDVELRLRQAGVTVSDNASPLLYANVSILCSELACAYNIAVEVQQAVRLALNPDAGTLPATTWNTGITGLLPGRRLQAIRQVLKDQVDQFLNSYLSANPK